MANESIYIPRAVVLSFNWNTKKVMFQDFPESENPAQDAANWVAATSFMWKDFPESEGWVHVPYWTWSAAQIMARKMGEAREARGRSRKKPERDANGLTPRHRRIVQRMMRGDLFGSMGSPRMTNREFNELRTLGFPIDCESAHGADPSGGLLYRRLDRAAFDARAAELGIQPLQKRTS